MSNAELFRAAVDAVNGGDLEAMLRLDNFEEFEVRLDEVVDVTADTVLALGEVRVRGKGSGAEVKSPAGIAVTFRGGLIVHHHDYGDHAAARAAAGL